MKPPVKALLIALTVLIVLPPLSWTAAFLYWRLRISAAIRWFESTAGKPSTVLSAGDPGFRKAAETIKTAGCRCLPYAVDAIDESKDSQFLASMIGLVAWHADIPSTDTTVGKELERLQLQPGDSKEVRREKVRLVQAWWREKGSEHHQWWRIWSGKCP